jgi:3-isopropylmalate dehydrogenase
VKGKTTNDVRFWVLRENTEDVYGNEGRIEGTGGEQTARVEMTFTRRGIERIVRYAFDRARDHPRRKHVTLVDKANAIPVQGLWRDVFAEVGAQYPDVARDEMYVDAAAMWMVLRPEQFDVVVTTNLFGDILTDLGAALTGGLGTAASGNIHPGKVSVFEPIHGSAPKYAGKNAVSPIGAIGALALMLDHVGEHEARAAINRAIFDAFRSGALQGVEAGMHGTRESAQIVAARL